MLDVCVFLRQNIATTIFSHSCQSFNQSVVDTHAGLQNSMYSCDSGFLMFKCSCVSTQWWVQKAQTSFNVFISYA